jgi:hypothetical protein
LDRGTVVPHSSPAASRAARAARRSLRMQSFCHLERQNLTYSGLS